MDILEDDLWVMNPIEYPRSDGDPFALWKTQLPHHPFGTSSERWITPRKPRLGLAGFERAFNHFCDFVALLNFEPKLQIISM